MRDDLLYYYERELTYLRRMGGEFARKYPKVASRLLLEPGKCEDPHVERLLEGFAFLTARVQLKIDDDFSEVSSSLLDVVYPNYIRPIPSMSIVEFELDPELGKMNGGFPLPRGSQVNSRPVGGVPCKFRTAYDTTLWPITVAEAQWTTPDRLKPPVKLADTVAALRLELRAFPDVKLHELELDTLRFYLNGETNLVSTLYELLCNNCVQIMVRDLTPGSRKRPIVLPASALTPVGFGRDEAMLPTPRQSLAAYGLLHEYFCFPEKFHFVDLAGFDQIRAAGFAAGCEVVMLFSPFERGDRRQALETGINASTFRLGCAPIVNLFTQVSEPILLTHQQYEYQVVPDARRRTATEVFSVDEVTGAATDSAEPMPFDPLYSFRHSHGGTGDLFWHAARRPSGWRLDQGTDMYLSFADLEGRTQTPGVDAITCRLTCFNSDLPSRLPFGLDSGDFELPAGGPVKRILALVKPTGVVHPPLWKSQMWRLVSLFSLKYLSLLEGGADGLQELLRLFNASDNLASERQIQGIKSLTGKAVFSRVATEQGIAFARGHRVEMEIDEEQFAGGGLFLFASVLERFLGLYASLNSFSQLVVRSQQRKSPIREWAPRAGWKPLI
jgi:type VI secretion system protein ImpG